MLKILRCLKPYPEKKKKKEEHNYILNGPIDLEALHSVEEDTLGNLLWKTINSLDPNDVAEECFLTEDVMTYGDLMKWGRATAKFLKQQKCSPNEIVVLCCENNIYFTPCFLGCLWNGTICAPIHCEFPLEDYEEWLKNCNPRFVISSPSTIGILKQAAANQHLSPTFIVIDTMPDYVDNIKGCLSLKEIWDDKNPTESFTPYIIPKDEIKSRCILILGTSGSMGVPKGARHTDASIQHFTQIRFSFGSRLITMATTGGFWIMGFYIRLANLLCKGMTIILKTFTWINFLKCIEKYKVQLTLASTAYIGNLINLNENDLNYDISSLKFIFVGGSAIYDKHRELMKKAFPKTPMIDGYSLTEICGFFVNMSSGTIGRLYKNCQAKVISVDTGEMLPPNEEGELLVKAPTMFQGYHNNPEATREAIDQEGWFHTGDVVYYKEDGTFYYVDRIKALIKYKGVHFNAPEIENYILSHPDVEEVCVIGIPAVNDWDHAKAFVVRAPNGKVTEKEIIQMVAEKFPDYKHLRGGVQFIDSMPKTSTGKIHRVRIRHYNIAETF